MPKICFIIIFAIRQFATPTAALGISSRLTSSSSSPRQHASRSAPPPISTTIGAARPHHRHTSTQLPVLLDVPDGFFTVTFPTLGLLLGLSKQFVRVRLEENAWEQRVAEARELKLQADPTVTELDMRRQEASLEWSAYGQPRLQEEAAAAARQQEAEEEERPAGDRRRRGGRKKRVQVMDNDDDLEKRRDAARMSDRDIQTFEAAYGVDYDPYYDDPYTLDELPAGKYKVDQRYGDVVYENGEIFYKDQDSGLYYRQGAKPRNLKFFG